MCGWECCISAKSIHSSLLSWRDMYFKKLKYQSQNDQNRSSGKKEHCIYETYKNTVMPHGRHIYAKAYVISKAKMCAYSQSDHDLPHWKCVLQCCAKCPSINITDQETDDQYPDTGPSIFFYIYHKIARCTKHGRLLLTDRKICHKCQQDYASGKSTKIYTRKYPVIMETTISIFHTGFCISAIQKLAFYIPHVKILGTNHCGDSYQTAFKRRKPFQDVLCRRDYSERVVASFPTKYNHNIMVKIDLSILRVLHWKFQCITTDRNKSTQRIMSMPCSV